jgi:ribonuclease HI
LTINAKDTSESLNKVTDSIDLYTDGSCHTQNKNGAWACIIFIDREKIILQDVATNTTHQRMEITAALEGLRYLKDKNLPDKRIMVYTDSQYLTGLQKRKDRFISLNYLTKDQKPIRNVDLVKELISLLEKLPVSFTKVKAHQQENSTEESRLNR